MKVFLTAQLPCPVRVLGYPHELFVAIDDDIEPDVSNATMKYGLAGAGHFAGSGSKHSCGSAARTGRGASEANVAAAPASSARSARGGGVYREAVSFVTSSSGRAKRR